MLFQSSASLNPLSSFPQRRRLGKEERNAAYDDAAAMPARLLIEATRYAGMFQRSTLGHLDHHSWFDRVQNDGQRLIDVLTRMGFRPNRDLIDKERVK